MMNYKENLDQINQKKVDEEKRKEEAEAAAAATRQTEQREAEKAMVSDPEGQAITDTNLEK